MAEATMPGANVSAVARSHGLTPQQVFTWRREAVRRARRESDAVPGTIFAEVRVEGTSAGIVSSGSVGGVVDLAVGDVVLRIGPSVSALRVRDLLRAVRSA